MDEQLFPRQVRAITAHANRDETGHWSLRIMWQFEGEPWHDDHRADMSRLSLSELVDVLLSTTELAL